MPFDSFPDPAQRKDLLRERSARLASTPIRRFEYHDVVFSTPNQDTQVSHTLSPTDPEGVHYVVTRISAGGTVYNDESATRKAWQPNLIWLRATAACTAHLLLYLHDDTQD